MGSPLGPRDSEGVTEQSLATDLGFAFFCIITSILSLQEAPGGTGAADPGVTPSAPQNLWTVAGAQDLGSSQGPGKRAPLPPNPRSILSVTPVNVQDPSPAHFLFPNSGPPPSGSVETPVPGRFSAHLSALRYRYSTQSHNAPGSQNHHYGL